MLTFRDAGISADEPACAVYGRLVLDWFATGGGDQRALHSWDWHWYGGLHEALVAGLARLLPLPPIETRHLCNAATGLLGAWGCARMATLVAGPAAGFTAALLLLTHPSWWGHLFTNSKDIPFAAAHTWAVVGLIRLAQAAPADRLRRSVISGTLIGLALAVRAGGMFLFGELAALLIALHWTGRKPSAKNVLTAIRWPLLAALVTGWIVMIAGWPYGLTHPFTGPVGAALVASHFPRAITFPFLGRMVSSTDLPWFYLPVSLLIRSPLIWSVLVPCGGWMIVRALRGRRPGPHAVLAVALVFPAALIMVTRAPLYNGIRHVLFLLPLLAVLGALAVTEGIASLRRKTRPALRALAVILVIAGGYDLTQFVRLHPYQYVFINRFAGGFADAPGRFEVDDYGHALREGWRRLATHHRAAGAARPGRVLVPHAGGDLATDFLPELLRASRPADAEYVLATGMAAVPRGARLLFSVDRLGVPLLRAYALRRAGDKILPVIPR